MTAPAGIVWLASFPKSGNTWFRIFLANLAASDSGPADINDLDERGGIASNRHEFEAATLLDSALVSHDDIDRLRPAVHVRAAANRKDQRWIKVHDAYTLNADGEPLLGRRAATAAIYLVRDPRDVAVSFAHHTNTTIAAAARGQRRSCARSCSDGVGMPPAGWIRPTRPSTSCATKTCAPTRAARSPRRCSSRGRRRRRKKSPARSATLTSANFSGRKRKRVLPSGCLAPRRSSAQAKWEAGAMR
jgi:hypothetical protein